MSFLRATESRRLSSIHSKTKEVYEKARQILNNEVKTKCTQDVTHDDRPGIAISAMFEHMWHVLFRKEGYLPKREHDYSLPLYLRTEGTDRDYGNIVLDAVASGIGL